MSIGWLDELEKQYDDPIAYFTKRVAQLNEEKQKKQAPINFTFYDSDRLCIGDNLRKNFGYAALSQIYHELGIHTFLINRQRHSKEQFQYYYEDACLFQTPFSSLKEIFL